MPRKTVVKKSSPARKPVERKTRKTAAKKTIRGSVVSSAVKQTTVVQQSTSLNQYLKNPRLWVGAAVIIVAILFFVFKGLFIAAVVNGEPVSRLQVISELEQQNGKQALDDIIVQTLITQEAQKRHISVNQSDIDGQIKQIETQLKGQNTTLDAALAARGMTRNQLTDQLKIQQLLAKMVGTSVKVTDADIQAYIDKNKDSLPTDLSDADLKAQVKSQLESQQLQDKTQAFVAQLQKQAKISYFVNY